MRKIESLQESERKSARSRKIITVFMLAILVFSSAGYAFLTYLDNPASQNPSAAPTSDGRWQVQVGDQYLVFSTSPQNVADIPITMVNTIQTYADRALYLDAESDAVLAEVQSTLGRYVRVVPACLGSCDRNVPEKTCTDTLVVWNQSSPNKVYQQDNCVFIQGDIRAVDAFIFKLLDIQ